ncbi:DUF2235 domain-containing protein [Cobetia sp. 4B]|uniref:phospholipase effector Tle1 domain-containing protein n=1 Tax=Cobetia sp. 4B TaxID=2758724 RepID=UPI001C05ADED|nr:DUF2235 domain-containing protein [Cobetia sp. 4B]MBR9754138.1 DUF2235 domain-containing protein [Gammaproteobacteria bacterium]QWN35798.1 DUF2235 domain-containing protein [Cobetia sp. 4B]
MSLWDTISWKTATFALVCIVLSGCSHVKSVDQIPKSKDDEPKSLVIFLDGTANDEISRTNISKLHSLVSLQGRSDIITTYIEGVGTNTNIIGMAMGWGIGHDVRQGYSFLANNYRYERGDKIYIFGFSRGAYAARILAALIHTAGIQDISKMDDKAGHEYIDKLYDAYKGEKSLTQRRKDVATVAKLPLVSRDIEFLGLWDTVEALGTPDYKEDTKLPNRRYGDQLCNIKSAAHALSADDNRARAFTPILLTYSELTRECKEKVVIDDIVDEVWFAGAHSDVGGGYADTNIDGVSLNWMLQKIQDYDIVPANSSVYADPLDLTHNPEHGAWGLIYRKASRSLFEYAETSRYNDHKLKLHRSLLNRLNARIPRSFEYQWCELGETGRSEFQDCFICSTEGIKYKYNSDCFTVVD